MSTTRTQAEQTLRTLLVRAKKDVEFDDSTSLYAEGLGLDSLEVAELSSMFEDDLGRDPFTAGLMPQTVGEMLDFFSEDPISQA